MGRALILIESLVTALFLVAMAAAWAAREPRRLRWAVPATAVAAVAVPAAFLVYGLNFMYRGGTVSLTSFVTATAWTAAFLVGSIVAIRAARRVGADPSASGQGGPWSVRSLTLAFIAMAVLTATTLSNLDTAVKGQI